VRGCDCNNVSGIQSPYTLLHMADPTEGTNLAGVPGRGSEGAVVRVLVIVVVLHTRIHPTTIPDDVGSRPLHRNTGIYFQPRPPHLVQAVIVVHVLIRARTPFLSIPQPCQGRGTSPPKEAARSSINQHLGPHLGVHLHCLIMALVHRNVLMHLYAAKPTGGMETQQRQQGDDGLAVRHTKGLDLRSKDPVR
jgi:hypothetical protein